MRLKCALFPYTVHPTQAAFPILTHWRYAAGMKVENPARFPNEPDFAPAAPFPASFSQTKTMSGGVSPIEDSRLMNESDHTTPWEACYRELAPKLLLFARQWVPVPADAEDVVQAAFIKFWQHRPDAHPEHYPLLYAAVRTCALDFRRSGERRSRREANPAVDVLREDATFFDHGVEQREDAALLEAALRELCG